MKGVNFVLNVVINIDIHQCVNYMFHTIDFTGSIKIISVFICEIINFARAQNASNSHY